MIRKSYYENECMPLIYVRTISTSQDCKRRAVPDIKDLKGLSGRPDLPSGTDEWLWAANRSARTGPCATGSQSALD